MNSRRNACYAGEGLAQRKHRKPNQMSGNPTSYELPPYDIQSKFEINNKTYK